MTKRPTICRWTTLLGLTAAMSCSVGCDREPDLQWSMIDEPQPQPKKVTPSSGPEEQIDPGETDPRIVAQCGRGTGKNAEGDCESLRRRDAGYVQQVQLPAGTFVMGDIPERYDAQKTRTDVNTQWSGNPPRHVFTEAFWIDLHEVTRQAYGKCVEAGDCTPAKCGADEIGLPTDVGEEVLATVPQTCVTYEQAQAFCEAQGARLPTEAEWEYAARGVDARMFPWGNNLADEFRHVLLPVGGAVDLSYFGLRGMGSNALELVANPFELDAGLAEFLRGEFRKAQGPLRKWFEQQPAGHVAKGGRTGARRRQVGHDPLVGFRCADDLEDGEEALTVPAAPPPVPLVANGEGLQIFGGVAEAVSREEAEAFCEVLSFESGDQRFDDWRLPTLSEIQANADLFRGPGPFWTQGGAAMQRVERGRPGPKTPWQDETAEPSEPLAARCVR